MSAEITIQAHDADVRVTLSTGPVHMVRKGDICTMVVGTTQMCIVENPPEASTVFDDRMVSDGGADGAGA